METSGEKVMVLCYHDACKKYGPNGVYYEGSTPKKMRVERNTTLSTLLDRLYEIFGLDKEKSKLKISGRYPIGASADQIRYLHVPVGKDDSSLESMLEVPSDHPYIKDVELYLEVKSTCDGVVDLDAGSSKQHQEAHELRVGLCFKDGDELKKAVDWCSIRGRQKCVVKETEKDKYTFECMRSKCKWSLCASRMEEDGLVEITKFNGPHTCCPIKPVEFIAEEIECLIRVQPTLPIEDLIDWWLKNYGQMLKDSEMEAAKLEAIKKVYGDWDQSFRVLPKLMAVFQSSNGLLVDWQYDLFPNPEFASFRGVFWAFSQSIEGFRHCRPLIYVDSKDLNGKYPMKLMIASGVDADNCYFPLAFAVTTDLSSDTWSWFLTEIRKKVTQRKDLCLVSRLHPDLIAAINKAESRWQEPWAYHMFCLDSLCSSFHDVFQDDDLKNLVDEAGSASHKEEFDSYLKDIEMKNSEARKWLDQFPQHQWAMAHDSGRRFGFMRMNTEHLFDICKSSLGLPVTAIALLVFDELRSSFYISLYDRKRGDMYYTEPAMEELKMSMTNSVTHDIMPLEEDAFQVTDPLEKGEWIVRLRECTCTCGEFQEIRIPCLHALAVCEKLKINPLNYVDDCYRIERLYETYSAKFSPVPQVSAWPEASGVPTLFPPVILPSSSDLV